MSPVSATSRRSQAFQQWSPLGILAGGIFVIDLLIPLGVTTGVLYIAVVLLSLRYRNSQLSLLTAIACSTLTIIALFLSPVGGEYWKVLINRALAIFVIWTTTLMGRQQLQLTETIHLREQTIQGFLDSMPTACFSFDRQGTILSWNPAAERMYGFSKKEAVGTSSYKLMVTPETQMETKNVIAGIFQGQSFRNMVWHDQNRNGELGWRAGNLFPVFDPQGNVAYGVNFNVDITAQKTAESELQAKHALLEAIFNSPTDAIYAKNREGKYLVWNQASANIVGKSSQSAIGSDDTQIFGPETAKVLRKFDEMVVSQNQSHTFEETIPKHDGPRIYSSTKSPLVDNEGRVIGLVGISRDITELKAAQKDLLLTDRVFMASPDHISILGRDYRYRRVNHSYEKAHGRTSEELIGMSAPDLLGEELFTQTVKPMLDRCFQGEDIHYEAWFTFRDDQRRYMSVSYLPLTVENQDIQEIVVIARDLTERKQVEGALNESERRNRSLVQSIPFCIHEIDLNGRILSMNAAGQKMIGIKDEAEIIGHSYLKLIKKEDYERVTEYFAQACQGKEVEFEFQVTKKGESIYYRKSFIAIRDAADQITSIMGTTEDITERKKAEERMIQSEQQLRTILDAMTNLVGIGSPEGIVLDCNQTPLTMAGLKREDVIGKPFIDTYWLNYSPEVQKQVRDILQRVSQGEIVRKDIQARMGENHFITVDACYVPVRDSNGQVVKIVHSGIDVTARREAEAALHANEQQLRTLLDSLMCFVGIWTSDGTFLDCNQFSLRASGLQRKDVIGKHITETYWVNYSPEVQQQLQSIFNRVKQGEIVREDIKVRSDDQTFLTIDACYVPLFDEAGKVVQLVGSGIDVTERRKAEMALQRNEEQFRDLYETAPLAFFSASLDGYLTRVNVSRQ